MLAPDREEQRKRDKKVSRKKHRKTAAWLSGAFQFHQFGRKSCKYFAQHLTDSSSLASGDPLPGQSATSSRSAYIKPFFCSKLERNRTRTKDLRSSYISWPVSGIVWLHKFYSSYFPRVFSFLSGFPTVFPWLSCELSIAQGWTPLVAERGASGRFAAWRSGQERRSQSAPSAAVWGPLWVGSSCCETLAEASWTPRFIVW